MGAKGKYEEWLTPDNLILIKGWRRDGLNFDQIAHNMGISRKTLSVWRNQYAPIGDALKRSSEIINYETENELYESARNRYVEEIEVIEQAMYDKDSGEKLQTVMRTTKKHRRYVPGNTTAQIYILKNRRADIWRDRQLVELQGDGLLAELIDGLKEPESDDLHEEATTTDAPVADQQAETN